MDIEQTYDPELANDRSKCWLNEVVNGVEGDLRGEQEFVCLHGRAREGSLAAFKQIMGPELRMCRCGHVSMQCCKECRDNSSDSQVVPNPRHTQLEDVMGLNQPSMAARMRSASAPLGAVMQSVLFGRGSTTSQTVHDKAVTAADTVGLHLPGSSVSDAGSTLVMLLILLAVLALLGAGAYFLLKKKD